MEASSARPTPVAPLTRVISRMASTLRRGGALSSVKREKAAAAPIRQTAVVAAAVTRALLVGLTVAAAMALYPGVTLHARAPWAIVWFGLMGATLLALMGLVASVWAEKFDHNAAVTNFVIAPLSLLSGTFYTIERLSGPFEMASRLNPFFYVISGFRYGFLGRSDIGGEAAVLTAGAGLLALNVLLGWTTYRILRSGWKIRS